MTPRVSSSLCLYAVSKPRPYGARPPLLAAPSPSAHEIQCRRRRYGSQPPPHPKTPDPATATSHAITHAYSARSALTTLESGRHADPVNPPRSTLPPPLTLPERNASSSVFVYWLSVGRAYGRFYKEGVKAVWYNHQAARRLRERMRGSGAKDGIEAARQGLITRSEWQVLRRSRHDIGKLPFFGLCVLVFGEWLPLLVPFIPGFVPGTCRFPKQVVMMRGQAEERRRLSFRRGVSEPTEAQVPDDRVAVGGRPAGWAEWPMLEAMYVRRLLAGLRDDQLHHLSSILTLHGRTWDRLQLPPPAFLLRRHLARHLQGLGVDDRLLLKAAAESPSKTTVTAKLSPVEVENACVDRGLDVLGKQDTELRSSLSWWLKRQQEDGGRGRAVLTMLFRRLAIRGWFRLNLRANEDIV
ncbi:LETM1-like protein [Teratosphaeria destructans]|uniref:LETM1-like protein n=1 Tax=Teratosphaeria destructans TaxID=418781 RepID=A0A9W7SQ89_9PEZI|nr:LETM1-like protein [Teratosphaeria destructans]